MTFSSQFDARQFLVNKIVNQAGRTARPLSEGERRMLELNLANPGSAAGIPVEMLEDASRTYEKKIAALLQAAYNRDGNAPNERQKYHDAVRALKDSNYYLLIIAADAIPRRKNPGQLVVYILIALAVAGMIAVLHFWTRSK